MNRTVAHLKSHCNNYDCDLGSFEYTCPSCRGTSNDYDDVWAHREDIEDGDEVEFECDDCGVMLVAYYDNKDGVLYAELPIAE